MQKEQADFDFPGYFEYWNSATTRKGYSGTAIFSKKEPLSVTCGMGLEEFDGEGRVIAAAKSGKVKTACTMVGIILMLIFPNATLRLVCVAVILVTTIYSGIEYFVKNKDVLAKGTM